eukprot:SAG31_NODE_1429_length_8390_cov_2.259076_5_plen_345_part_00
MLAQHSTRVLCAMSHQLINPARPDSAAGGALEPPPPPTESGGAEPLWSAVWTGANLDAGDPAGWPLHLLASKDSDGLFAEPTGLAMLKSGLLVVSDCKTNRLAIVDPLADSVVRTIGGVLCGKTDDHGADSACHGASATRGAAPAICLARPYCVEVIPSDGKNRPEMLAICDRNHHRIVWVDPTTGELIGSFGGQGLGKGQFGGTRAAVRVRGKRLVVVENDNNRLQLVSSRPDQAEKVGGTVLQLVAVGGARAPETLTGAGGLSTLSGGWCGAPHDLLAIADSHANRVAIVDIHQRRDEQQGVIVRTIHGGNKSNGRYARFDVPTDVAELREGLLAVVDRGGT